MSIGEVAPASAGATQPLVRPSRGVTNGLRTHFPGGLVFLSLIALFGAVRPSTFLTISNAQGILEMAAVPMIFAAAVTIVMIAHEFDLSFGAVAGAASAIAVVSMVDHGLPPLAAAVLAIVLGAVVGACNGVSVKILKLPSLVATLAMTSIAVAAEHAVGGNRQIFTGIPSGFLDATRGSVALGLTTGFWFAVLIVAAMAVLTKKTVFGRHLEAVGGNTEAAHLAGVPVTRRVIVAFALTGALAAVGGLVMTSKATAYYPEAAAGALLPVYTAVFLGLIFDPKGRFNVAGSAFGVVLLTVLQSGLTIWNQPGWLSSLIQGFVLIGAVASFQLRRARA